MNVIIRADASVEIGTGHIMRCLTLAEDLHGNGAEVLFICRELPGNLCNFLEDKGYRVFRLPMENISTDNCNSYVRHASWLRVPLNIDVEQTRKVLINEKIHGDWLIVDHYALGEEWERQIRPYVKNIMVIDDLADRVHDCDLLLDQNFYKNPASRYEGLVPYSSIKLLGPKYALLRPEFIAARKNLRQRDGKVKRIFIFLGGSDPTNETVKALEAFRLLNKPDIAVDVVVGSTNPHKEQVGRICGTIPRSNFYCQVENMAQLMADADLAIGAGGTTMWERCYLGLPSITIVVADNQFETAQAVGDVGGTWNLGWNTEVGIDDLINSLQKALNNPDQLLEMGEKALKLMNGICSEPEKSLLEYILGVCGN